TVSAAGTLQGGDLVASKITASLESGTATIENAIDFGTIVRTIEVPNADATLALTGNVTLNGINNDRLIKTGSGTLVLNGTNTNLIRMAIGIQSATTPVDGGIVLFGNKNALGNSKTFLNYGVLKASTELIGANALPIGISFSGRDGSPSVLEGESFEFTGADSELYSLAAGSGDIRANVNNHTIISGPVFASTSSTITGLAVGGSGKLTLSGALSSFTTALKLKDSVTVELNPGSFDSLSSTNAVVYETLSLATGTTLAVTTIGTTGVAKAYSSVNAESGSVIQFDIGGTARGDAVSGYDVLSFAATAAPVAPPTYTFAGAIKVQFVSGFVPAAGQTFDILDWDASATPDFAAVSFDLPDVSGANLIWDTSDFTTDGTLKILLNVVTVEVTPVTQNLNVGDTAVFTATATGPGTITYQWQYGTTDIPDETGTTLTIENVAVVNSGNYRCVVSNGVDTVASEPVTLTVTPAVTGFVASRTPSTDLLYVGDKVTFKVTGGGSGLTYQWLKGSSPIEGATSSTYVIDATATTDTADYSVLVSNGGPQVPSNVVPLTVLTASPVIVTDPTPQQLLKVGDAFSLQVTATGRPPLRYQWSRDGKPISGATRSSFSSPSATLVQGGTYTCEVSNQAGESDSSDSALVGVVLTNTLNINLAAGKNGSFKVQANGPNLSFNWLRDGAAQPPANFSLSQDGKTLTGTALLVEDYGTYACTVTMGLLTQVGGTHNLKVFDQAPESPETVEMPDGIIGGSYTYAMPYTVSEPPREAPSTFAAKGLPSGLKMDTKTGIISGRPTKSGDFSVTMTAKNTLGSTTTIGSLLIKAYPDSLSGVYVGLVERSTEINGSLGGRVDLTVTTTGSYSGTLTLGATKYKLKGIIEVNAETPDAEEVPTVLSLIVPRKGDPVPLQVDIVLTLNESEDRYLTGSVSDGVNTAAMEGYRYKWNVKTGPSATAYAQYYTFRTELAESELIGDSTVPQGSGYGTFTLKPDGKVKIVGSTGDGQKLTLASYLGPVGEILVYQTVYTPVKGSIGGSLEITAAAQPEDNTLTGELSVIRPANAKSRAYKEGFGPLELDAFGAAYTPDTTTVALDLTAGSSANLLFTEAGLTSELVETSLADVTVTINAKDKTVITSPSPSPTLTKFSSLKSKTGLFAGTFTLSDENPISAKPPILKRKSKFQGVIVKELTGYYGYGYFLLDQLPTTEPPTTTKTSPNLSGHAEFAPVEE
ncbi:MAG: immunoglobulin domain-containing protein, partial [Prosthecobacter sp.]|nr:immunoglobulin domain-containing protein [Prosthecobacter sp.]